LVSKEQPASFVFTLGTEELKKMDNLNLSLKYRLLTEHRDEFSWTTIVPIPNQSHDKSCVLEIQTVETALVGTFIPFEVLISLENLKTTNIAFSLTEDPRCWMIQGYE